MLDHMCVCVCVCALDIPFTIWLFVWLAGQLVRALAAHTHVHSRSRVYAAGPGSVPGVGKLDYGFHPSWVDKMRSN